MWRAEMERRAFTLPLLIGGATTSRQHTAVKIAPALQRPRRARARRIPRRGRRLESAIAHTASEVSDDASREQATLREQYANRQQKPLLSFEAAKENRLRIDWPATDVPKPSFIGRREVEVPLADLVHIHRLDVLLPCLGTERPRPWHLRAPRIRGRSPRPLR